MLWAGILAPVALEAFGRLGVAIRGMDVVVVVGRVPVAEGVFRIEAVEDFGVEC